MQGQGTLTSALAPLIVCLLIGVVAGYFTWGTKENIPFARERTYASVGAM